ncbi:MAG: DUF6077 domain-containing protein [Ornithinibacter sp.]
MLYHLGCWLNLPTTPLLVATVAVTVVLVLLTARREAPLVRTRVRSGAPARSVAVFCLAAVLAVLAVALLTGRDSHYRFGWLLAVASVGLLVLTLLREGPVEDQVDPQSPVSGTVAADVGDQERRRSLRRTLASLFVLLVGLVGGILTLFVYNVSFDDVFYVNKAVFVAENGTIPLRDTMYSSEVLPAIRGAGTVPVQSFEVFQGAVAHVVGMSGGTAAYMVTPPIVLGLTVWVMWWLCRTWSRGAALSAFVVGASYLAFGMYTAPGANGSIAMSSIPLRAAWQGKVVLLCVALPMAYLALSRWATHRRARDLLLVFMIGAASVGLSGTATFLVPPIALTVTAAMMLTRRAGWAGALALALYPLGAGVVASLIGGGTDYGELLRSAPEAFHGVVGQGVWGWLGGLALLLGAWAVRRGGAGVVAASASLAGVVVIAPFMPGLVAAVTGAGPIVWRLPWIIPIPVLLGVLAAAPLAWRSPGAAVSESSVLGRIPDRLVPVLSWGGLVLVLLMVVLGGRPVWAEDSPGRMMSAPAWKFPALALEQAAALAERAPTNGPVLAPRPTMGALAITTADVHAVDPRAFFLQSLVEDPETAAARRRLSVDMRPGQTRVSASFADDLDRLEVAMVCLDRTQSAARDEMGTLGWAQDRQPPVGLRCWRRSP